MTRLSVPAEATAELDRWLGGKPWSATSIAGDASARTYFRIRTQDGRSAVLTYYPEQVRESLTRFLKAHEALRDCVPIPSLLERGDVAVLQEDVGDLSLTDLLRTRPEAAQDRYREAAALLERISQVGMDGRTINPAFDQAKFLEELDMTRRFYVEDLAGTDSGALAAPFESLAERLASHPYTLCHRDYHGQNLLLFKDSIYVIDYQDMRMGPDMYDLASLLRDRGVWKLLGPGIEAAIITERADATGDMASDVRTRYVEALLQRSLKAIGTFARLVVVYGRQQYLAYIGPTLETVRECTRELDDWQDLPDAFPFDFQTP